MNNYWESTEFIKAVKLSFSIGEVLKYFDLPTNSGSYYYNLFHSSVKELNVNISHFNEHKHKNKNFTKISTPEILVKGKYKATSNLKTRLIEENLLKEECYECGMGPQWNDKNLSLQLDHINGDNTDNRLENLRILCPNCHSQTETYAGKGKKQKHTHKFICKICGGPKKSGKSNSCRSCAPKIMPDSSKFRIQWPDLTTILNMLEILPFTTVGKQLEVSDNAIRKFLKRNNIDPKTLKEKIYSH